MTRKNETKELNQIKNVAARGAKNLRVISEVTSIPYKRIIYILSHHPIVKDRVMNTLSENREKKVSFINEAEKEKFDVVAMPIEDQSADIPQLPVSDRYVVIDASVCGSIGTLTEIHQEITEKKSTIILTDLTISELEKLEDGIDKAGYTARRILVNSATHPETYFLVKIDQTGKTDNDIVNFASKIKTGKVVLFTSDKAMSLNARLAGIEVNFLDKPVFTLRGIFEKNLLRLGRGVNKAVVVLQNGKYFYEGVHELKPDDQVFVFTRPRDNDNMLIILHFVINGLNSSGEAESKFCDKRVVTDSLVPRRYLDAYNLLAKMNF